MSDFIDALVNKLAPDEQIMPIVAPEDQIIEDEMTLAEQVGLKLVSHAGDGVTNVGDPDRFTDTTNSPFTLADIGRYIRITSGANVGLYRIATFVDASNVDCVNPDGTAASFATDAATDYSIHDEPSLESSANYMLTQLRQIVDDANDWFQPMPRAFDPSNTDVSDTKNEKVSLKVFADNWYGSKTKIVDVITDSFAVSDTDTGHLYATALGYADNDDRRGLVIQNSVGNTYHDEVALGSIVLGKHKVTLIDPLTDAEFTDASGNLIYGVLQDGADHAGTGEGTDVFIKFVYDNAGVPTNYTWTANDPANVIAFMPQRKRRSEMNEYDDRRTLVSSIVGDAEQSEDIAEIRSALGLADGEVAGGWDLTNTGNFFPFSELSLGTATMEDIVNKLNEEIGDRDYSAQNYITNGESISDSLDKLDVALSQAGIKTKIVERVAANIDKGATHTIPFASGSDAGITTYKQDTGHRGLYMDVYVAGKKLVPDSSAIATDGEYEETSTTQVTFRFKVNAGQIIEYVIKDDV